jgi:hypothetical protein
VFLYLAASSISLHSLFSRLIYQHDVFMQAPNELQKSHPAIAEEMSKTWAEAWGNLGGPVLVGLGGVLVGLGGGLGIV